VSSYSRLIFIFLLVFNISLSGADKFKEGLYTLMALDEELHQNYNNSALLYSKLFDFTQDYGYLNKAVYLYAYSKNTNKVYQLAKKTYKNKSPYKTLLTTEYIISAIALNKLDGIEQLAQDVLKKHNTSYNYTLVGDVYYAKKEYDKAITYYESAYAKDKNLKALLNLVDILYSYLNKKKEALSYLETYYREYGCNKLVCAKLVRLYQQEQNIDGMISILTVLNNKFKTQYTPKQYFLLQTLLVELLEKKDIKLAIQFLEKNRINDIKLLHLYSITGEYKKALDLVRKQYKATKDKSLLGQIAILEFELAKDKKKMFKHIFANFELALKVKPNANYENYYGYLLIDYDINIKKGLYLVKKALQKYPNNVAYKDSVAWGYYKNKQCTKAYKYMKEVIDEVGLDNEEIKLHWEKIKDCR